MPENCIKLNLDTNQRIHNGTRYAKQGDAGSRRLEVTVTCDSAPVDLTGCRAVFYAKKPSWKGVYNDASITDAAHGVISVELTDQTLAEAGRLQCEITLYGPENSILSTLCTDEILVSPTVRDDEAIESTNEFTALTRAMSEVSDAAGRAQAQADAAEGAADKAAEIYHQVLSDLEAGNLKGDKGNTGPTGPTGPRGYPGGVTRMRTLSLPCTVPIGAEEETPASVRLEDYDGEDTVTIVSMGLNLFDPKTAAEWSTANSSKTVIDRVTEDGAIHITCKGSGATVTTPVIALSVNQPYTITREVSNSSVSTGTFSIIECDGESGTEGAVIFSHNNNATAQRSYLFTASCPYIKIKWTAISAIYGDAEIRYEINEGNPYDLPENAEGTDLGLSLKPYQYTESTCASGGIEIPVYAGGRLLYRSGRGAACTARAEVKTGDVTLLETTLEEGVDLVEIDRHDGRVLSGLSEAVITAGRAGEVSHSVMRRYAPGTKRISEYAADIGVGGSLQPGDTITIKGA